ncbi:Hypothetical predicted protein, partial [Paramuricea clavata]
ILTSSLIQQNIFCNSMKHGGGVLEIGKGDTILYATGRRKYTRTQSAHDQSLEAVFQRLKERGLTLNKHKCEYGKDKLEFYGYVFPGDSIAPDPKKIDDIVNLQTPTFASEVRSLLGMTNYCSRFIPDYATKTELLRKLTHKDQPWEWTSQHDSAVDQLKEALSCWTAAILSQVDRKTGTHHIVTYASRSLSETEQRYRQAEREALAVVWACKHLHLYIYGKPVTIYNDHKPLVSIYGNPSSKPPARIQKWALRLQPYQLTVRYRKGEGNPADYLLLHPSKQPTTASREQKIAEEYVNYITSTPKALTDQEIEEATKADSTL